MYRAGSTRKRELHPGSGQFSKMSIEFLITGMPFTSEASEGIWTTDRVMQVPSNVPEVLFYDAGCHPISHCFPTAMTDFSVMAGTERTGHVTYRQDRRRCSCRKDIQNNRARYTSSNVLNRLSQTEEKRRPFVFFRFRPNGPPMLLDNPFHN